MTRDEASTEAAEQQRRDPTGTWMAVQRGDEWVVMRISVPADTTQVAGVAVTPKPVPPHDKPFSEVENIVRKYGTVG